MNRPPAIVWLILLLLLLPTAAGRILIDVVGGVALVLVAVPLILTGLGWKLMQAQAERTSNSTVSSQVGSRTETAVPASEVTIDVTAQDVDSDS